LVSDLLKEVWVCVQGQGKESCEGCHNYVPCDPEQPLLKKSEDRWPYEGSPRCKAKEDNFRERRNDMTEESNGWSNPTCEEIDDIEVLDPQSTRRPYKVLKIEFLGTRELWEVPMSKET